MDSLNISNADNFRYWHKLSRTVTDRIETKLAQATATATKIESFRFYDEDDRNNDSFSILNSFICLCLYVFKSNLLVV